MIVRIFRAIWFMSVLSVLGALLYHYASLPEEVVIGQGEINFITLGRDSFFYAIVAIVALVNVTVFITRRFTHNAEEFQSWFYGFIGVINFFLIIALSFVSLFNSSETFDFDSIGFIIYGSMLLIGGWLVGGILYWLVKRKVVQ